MARGPLGRVVRRRQDHRGAAVGDLRAVVAPQPPGDDRVVALVGLERVLRAGPSFRVCAFGLRRAFSKLLARERGEVLGLEPVAAVVLVAERREHLGPHHRHALGLVRHPRRGAEVGDRVAGRHVAHHLDADDARDVVAARLEVGHRREHRDAARRARGLVARRRQPGERRDRPRRAARRGAPGRSRSRPRSCRRGRPRRRRRRRPASTSAPCTGSASIAARSAPSRLQLRREVGLRAAEDEDRRPGGHGASRWRGELVGSDPPRVVPDRHPLRDLDRGDRAVLDPLRVDDDRPPTRRWPPR